jgi:mRNA-degrading endonuclease toxin of MazEF toxin-antitoxin module
MIPTGSLKFGDIVCVNFDPSLGHEYQKLRPAVVIQADEICSVSSLITVMPISSQVSKAVPHDIVVAKNSSNNLYDDSIIKVYWISSFDYSRITKKIGSISLSEISNIKEYVKTHFEITS